MSAESSESVREFAVPEDRLPWLAEKLAKLARRAERLGTPPIGYTVLRWEDRPDPERPAVLHRYAIVTVSGPAPAVAGWTLRATLAHVEGEVLIRHVPGGPDLPERFRHADPEHCDHCGTVRQRRDTFVLEHDDGRYAQVGRNCLGLFLGGQSPESVAHYAEYAASVESAAEEAEGWTGGYERWRIDALDLLTLTAAAIRQWGWLSKSKAAEADTPGLATAERVLDYVWRSGRGDHRPDPQRDIDVLPGDEARALAALEWAKTCDESDPSDYAHNLATAARLGAVEHRFTGLLASAIVAAERAQGRERERQATAESQFQGQVRERLTVAVTVLTAKEFDDPYGRYGPRTLYVLRDAAGNVYKWWASGTGHLERGASVTLTGTVKAHEVYQGRRETVLTRCKAAK